MKVPFYNLSNEYKFLRKEINTSIRRVLESQEFILGKELEKFEQEFSEYLGVSYCVGVGSGTDGLMLALRALEVGPKDEVILPANSFIATAFAVTALGAKPVLVDVDPATHQMDVLRLRKAFSPRTKVVMPVHMFGSPVKIDEIVALAKSRNVKVIEDACQAHGGEFAGKKLGTFGDISVFSFYPSKNLGAFGDGGAICTNSKKIYKKLLLLRNYGQEEKYYHLQFGINSRLDDLQAAVLRIKLRHLDEYVKQRTEVASFYRQNLKIVEYPSIYQRGKSAYHLFVVTLSERDRLQAHLRKKGIGTQIHYPVPIHLQKVYESLNLPRGAFPVSENLSRSSLSLPLFYGIKKSQLMVVVDEINAFVKHNVQ